ncbi:ABC transporter substrate-binding protein [Herbiconiux daphne]|uniref:ABC transporter substrate-binding protein n=1 Tax=Herbiconiux daphne TaxID=2970914 RepID=A0ABT2H715_9MICO|nr:ABC transporter substrate-binding protein [Herbiconiux daphne]MCS5735725.1 ABC transporter substrate-binding protein [Herbiconiux daphne]
MKFRNLAPALVAGVVTAIALTGCTAVGSSSAGTTLTIGQTTEPTSYDPSQAQEGHYMQYYQAVYDSLIRRSPDGELEPMLASQWEYNQDNTVLTVDLRDDVTFSDGAAFDADAAKANLDHFRSGTGPQGSTLAHVSAVDVVDDDTITITLSEPDPALLIYLSNAAGLMASPAALGTDEISTTPVGSGPYTLDKSRTVTGSQYTFVKRDDYWDSELQHYDTIVIKPIPDVTARYNALVSGQVDTAVLDAKTADQADAAGLNPAIQQLDWQGILINDRDGAIVPALADVRVRQAINYAIDKEAILVGIQNGRGEVTDQVFNPASTAYDESLEGSYPYDPEKAKALMAEAGYADGFSVDFPTISLFDPALLAVLKEQLAAIGITINVFEVPINDFIPELTSGKYPLTLISLFQPSTWVNVNQVIAPDALFNLLKSENDTVDKLISTIQTGDAATADTAAKELNAYVVDQAWFAPFFRTDQLLYGNDKVKIVPQIEQGSPSIYNYMPVD